MKSPIVILILCAGISHSASAQTYTQRIQQRTGGQGTVTIHHSADIDQLVNEARFSLPSSSTSASPTTTPSPAKPTIPTKPSSPVAPSPADPTADNAPVDNTKKIMRGYKVSGYRVQAFAGGNSRKDRLKAEQIGDNIKANFPEVPVYVHFYSPRWICRIGNYRTYEEAHQMLLSVRKLGYSQATIVKGKITVQY